MNNTFIAGIIDCNIDFRHSFNKDTGFVLQHSFQCSMRTSVLLLRHSLR